MTDTTPNIYALNLEDIVNLKTALMLAISTLDRAAAATTNGAQPPTAPTPAAPNGQADPWQMIEDTAYAIDGLRVGVTDELNALLARFPDPEPAVAEKFDLYAVRHLIEALIVSREGRQQVPPHRGHAVRRGDGWVEYTPSSRDDDDDLPF